MVPEQLPVQLAPLLQHLGMGYQKCLLGVAELRTEPLASHFHREVEQAQKAAFAISGTRIISITRLTGRWQLGV